MEPYMQDFIAFDSWLQIRKGLARRTATIYCSIIRRSLHTLGQTARFGPDHWTQEEVEAVLNVGSSQQQANRRVAWNMYAEFMEEMEGLKLARPRSARQVGKPLPVLPKATLEALVTLMMRMKINAMTINRYSWRHMAVQPMGTAFLRDPVAPKGVWVQVNKETVDGLREWATPDESGNTPLVPDAPGSFIPMEPKVLRAVYQQYLRSL
jgi:hypothetical protein